MAIRILYRIDQRPFVAGDEMPPPGDHMEDLQPAQQTAERILRAAAGADREHYRADMIFTFDSLDWVKRYFMGKNDRTVYELEVDDNNINYGDSALISRRQSAFRFRWLRSALSRWEAISGQPASDRAVDCRMGRAEGETHRLPIAVDRWVSLALYPSYAPTPARTSPSLRIVDMLDIVIASIPFPHINAAVCVHLHHLVDEIVVGREDVERLLKQGNYGDSALNLRVVRALSP